MENRELLIEDDHHSLLEETMPAYSDLTLRRAYIVWSWCGQTNLYRDVCQYYHHLENMEEKLSAEKREISRRYEFDLYNKEPPISPFLQATFPNLYLQKPQTLKEANARRAIYNEYCKRKNANEITRQNGATTDEILAASQIIRNYCKNKSTSLKNFMAEYKKYSEICNLKNTVNNVAYFIKRKMIHDELILAANTPKSFSFLNTSNPETMENKPKGDAPVVKSNIDCYEYLMNREYKENKVPNGMRKISKSQEGLNTAEASKPLSKKNINNNKVLIPNLEMSNVTFYDLNKDLKKLKFGGQNSSNTMSFFRNDD